MEFFDKVLAALNTAMGASVTIALVLEFVFRMIKSPKPLGWLHFGAAVLKKSGEVLGKVAALLDKVLPQRLAEPKA